MSGIPVLKPREVVSILQRLGFQEVRQSGSHKQFRHADGRCTTVPFHADAIFVPLCGKHTCQAARTSVRCGSRWRGDGRARADCADEPQRLAGKPRRIVRVGGTTSRSTRRVFLDPRSANDYRPREVMRLSFGFIENRRTASLTRIFIVATVSNAFRVRSGQRQSESSKAWRLSGPGSRT